MPSACGGKSIRTTSAGNRRLLLLPWPERSRQRSLLGIRSSPISKRCLQSRSGAGPVPRAGGFFLVDAKLSEEVNVQKVHLIAPELENVLHVPVRPLSGPSQTGRFQQLGVVPVRYIAQQLSGTVAEKCATAAMVQTGGL